MKLSKEEVVHVADLARLYVDDTEVDKYGIQLYDILTEIEKIKEVDIDDTDVMISPTNSTNMTRSDVVGAMLKKEEIFRNVKSKSGDYIVAVKALNE